MLVKDHDDLTKELKRTKESYSQSGSGSEEEYELQFAWDKQANFLNAQSRAMGELRSLIKQFSAIANEEEERTKKLELMQANIDKIKYDMSKDNQNDGPIEITITRKGDR